MKKVFTMYNSFNTWNGWIHCQRRNLDLIEIFSGDIRGPNGVQQRNYINKKSDGLETSIYL